MYYGARTRARKVSNPTRRFLLREKGGKEGTGRPMLSIRPGTRGATVVLCTLRRPSPALVHHLAGPRRIVCTAALCWSSSDGRLPRDYESNTVLLCLVRSKRYSSLKFCIWPVLLYSVIIEDYIYVRVLAGLNTGCNNNIIKTYFRGLELGLRHTPIDWKFHCASFGVWVCRVENPVKENMEVRKFYREIFLYTGSQSK